MNQPTNTSTRLHLIKQILDPKIGSVLDKTITKIQGMKEIPEGPLSEVLTKHKTGRVNMKKIEKVDVFADLLEDDESLTRRLVEKSEELGFESIKDLALGYDSEKLADLFHANQIPEKYPGETQIEKEKVFAKDLAKKIYRLEPSASVQRLLNDELITFSEKQVKEDVSSFLEKHPDFDIRKHSMLKILADENTLKGISAEQRIKVESQLKTLQRVASVSPSPKALEVLYNKKVQSAGQISQMSQRNFIRRFEGALGKAEAKEVYQNATAVTARNHQALMTIREIASPTGIAMIDNSIRPSVIGDMYPHGEDGGVRLSYETLFGSADFCECGHCNSVYSPSAYFVELLQYIRNNNLEFDQSDPSALGNLSHLFARRPDLKCLLLTCENAFTILPYIDLVNEVMESYVAFNNNIPAANPPSDIEVDLPTHNTFADDESSTLLAQPQYVKKKAYCTLSEAVFPFCLPYSQPVDAIRIFLREMNTTRYDLMHAFVPFADGQSIIGEAISATPSNEAITMTVLEEDRWERALCAEKLLMTEQEYVVIGKEAFASHAWYEAYESQTLTVAEYHNRIELKSVRDHYFHSQETTPIEDLQWVQKEFLPRTGLSYAELVDVLKTFYINPYQPRGEARRILELINIPYQSLLERLNPEATDPEEKYIELIRFILHSYQQQQIWRSENPDPCTGEVEILDCLNRCDLETWVYYYFERIGKMIVLESKLERQYSFTGRLVQVRSLERLEYSVNNEAQIINRNGSIVGQISDDLVVTWVKEPNRDIDFALYGGESVIAKIKFNGDRRNPQWNMVLDDDYQGVSHYVTRDTCDISKVKVRHLDGTELEDWEWDRIQRFIRLQKKMAWGIEELDSAILGLSAVEESVEAYEGIEPCEETEASRNDDCDCSRLEMPTYLIGRIDAAFLCQLAKVKTVKEQLNISLPSILSFWNNIEIRGEKSLYAKLFLKKNLRTLDPVFVADAMDEYLTGDGLLISEHIPAIMAGLNIKGDDVSLLDAALGHGDVMNLESISKIYRYQLLARFIGLKTSELIQAVEIIGDPFSDAEGTIRFLSIWEKVEDSDLNLQDLLYILNDVEDTNNPVSLSIVEQLNISLNIFEGIKEIDENHGAIDSDNFTIDLLRTKLELSYDPIIVDQMIRYVEGTLIYETNTADNLSVNIGPTSTLNGKVTYINNSPDSCVKVVGLLSDVEKIEFEGLNGDAEWTAAVTRIENQATPRYDEIFFELLLDIGAANAALVRNVITGDDFLEDSSLTKGMVILEYFLPVLRTKLKDQLVVDLLSKEIETTPEVTDNLLRNILKEGVTSIPLLETFKAIGVNASPPPSGSFDGFLVPPTSEAITFIVKTITGNTPGRIFIDGNQIQMMQLADPSNVHVSAPQSFTGGNTYTFRLENFDEEFTMLKWKEGDQVAKAIPSSAMIPNHLAANFEPNFKKLQKASMMADAYELSNAEIGYLQAHGSDFDDLDFNELTFEAWLRLHDYSTLRDELSQGSISLIEFFQWAQFSTAPIPEVEIISKINELTLWNPMDIEAYIQWEHFNILEKSSLVHEKVLTKLVAAQKVKGKININVSHLFEYAKPSLSATSTNREDFNHFWKVSNDLQSVLKARYGLDNWEEVVKPLNDELRTNQRNALIPYLLNQKALKDWGVIDADSLYEFFLIDVQMEACMETSRIKQAISSTQLFIQRVFLNLESGVANTELDRERWEWMSRYRIWEANRKVFLYPENWIETELRDDKSAFYKELESELLQKDINPDMVKDALKSYLYKLDEVADMKVVGMCVQQDQNGFECMLHVFSQTKSAPYFTYYRNFDIHSGNWSPWEKLDTEIPVVNFDDGQKYKLGTYLMPTVWNNRLFIFFPEFLKKTAVKSTSNKITIPEADSNGETNIVIDKPDDYFEIKIGFSEFQNGKWTQKKISTDSITKGTGGYDFYEILDGYDFRLSQSSEYVRIHFYHNDAFTASRPYDYFEFDGNYVFAERDQSKWISYVGRSSVSEYHYDGNILYPRTHPSVNNSYSFNKTSKRVNGNKLFVHQFSSSLIKTISTKQLRSFFEYTNESRVGNRNHDFGAFTTDLNETIFHELKSAYSIYNWELFFHLPMAIAENLSKNQQFEEAMKWYHFIFHPFEEGQDANRFWKFLPFKYTDAHNYIESLFSLLQPNQSNNAITEWRDNPFNPHLIARSRPSAYMKWTVMKYLDNILEWGDHLFRQDTIESVNYASQLYILASHILGRRPQQIPKRGRIKAQSYLHLMEKLDVFSNASVDLEIIFPYSNQISLPDGQIGSEIVNANLFGMAKTKYFCLPNNPKLMSYWDTFSDRLYKIRHCLNIEGVFRRLSLFEPPIDPALLVAATAQGLSLGSVLNELNTPVPNYRFNYMLQKAFELCNEVKSLGNTLLSTLEKKDGEKLSLMRASHEVGINKLVLKIRKHQLDEAQKSLDSLYENRRSPVYRMKYYLQQIGEDLSKVPAENSDYSELADKVEAVLDNGGLKLINLEKQELDKSNAAAKLQLAAGIVETTVGIMSIIPDTQGNVEPVGIGASISFGGVQLSSALAAAARGIQTASSELSFQSSNAARKAGFTRQLQDRIQQANLAGREIKQIDKQIIAQKIRIQMAEQELENQQQQIDNSTEVRDYLKTKYTNEQLYKWMEGELKSLFYQSYKMAYDLAKKVEGLYRFERGLTSTNFIQYGTWNSARDGLLSGEQLYHSLKQLEIAHQETRAHHYEITNKQISLRKLDPMALLNFRESGTCEFMIPEELFDMDFPGQFKRRIKTVSFSIPCIAGPYTSISAKASLTEHTFRIKKIATGNYQRSLGEDDDRFMTANVPISSVALSSAQNDGGVFELNFRDERYMPFEGAGAISKWKLELPAKFKHFDYHTISDVIIHMSYTSCEGGQQLKEQAEENLEDILERGESYPQFALFDLKHDFAQEWYKSMLAPNGNNAYVMEVQDLMSRMPYFATNGTVSVDPDSVKILTDENVEDPNLNVDTLSLGVANAPDLKITFSGLVDVRRWLVFSYTL